MNRLQVLKQRAAKRGVGIMRSMTNPGAWDVVDSCGPRGLELSRRGAIQFAACCALRIPKVRVYQTDADGRWHRGTCEKVAHASTKSHPCNCGRLVVP